jgi:hypothetical protein
MVKWRNKGTSVVVLIFTVVITVISGNGLVDPLVDENPIRLPRSVLPIHYDLSITTNVHTGAFPYSGSVKIQVKISEDTNVVTLHNRGLTIQFLELKDTFTGNTIETTYRFDTSKDFLIIETSEDDKLLQRKEYSIEIHFTGRLRRDVGFYRSEYRVKGETTPRRVQIKLKKLFLITANRIAIDMI